MRAFAPNVFNSIGYDGSITDFTGQLGLSNGELTGGSVTVEVTSASNVVSDYTYDIVANSGNVTRSMSTSIFQCPGIMPGGRY